MPASKIPEDANDDVALVYQNFLNVQEYHHRRIKRTIENWRFYWAHDPELGLGQWPEKVASRMVQEQRQLTQYNITMTLVDNIAGGILQAPVDPKYYPVNDEITTLTQAVTQAMFSDKELMDWPAAFYELVRAGLIGEGCLKMVVDDQWDSKGNIKFESCLPNAVLPDPYWRTWGSKDCKRCWKETWMTGREIAETYPTYARYVRPEIESDRITGTTYGANEGVTAYSINADDRWGSQMRVIEQYEMRKVTKTRDYALTVDPATNTSKKRYIPEDLKEPSDKIRWLNDNVPDWQPDFVFQEEYKERVCWVKAICPAISWSEFCEDGPTEIQIGRLPFFWWAASRANGESHSIVDSIRDAQQTLNYWESLLTYKLQIEGGGGAQFADPTKFVTRNEFDRFKQGRNNPAETFEMRAGALDGGPGTVAQPVYKSAFPQEVYAHINHIIEVLVPWISKVTHSARGEKDGPNDSGRLFELMKIQSDQQLYTIHYGLRIFYNEIYEAYLLQAGQTYSAEHLPRVFPVNGGKGKVVLNERVRLPDGTIAIKNDASMLRYIRHKVIVSESPASPTERLANLRGIGEFIKGLPPEKAATIQFLTGKASTLIDIVNNDEDKAVLEALGEAELELAVSRIKAATAQMRLAEKDSLSKLKMLEQREQQQMVMPPAPVAPGVAPQPAENPPAGPPPQAGVPEPQPIPAPQAQEAGVPA